MTILSDALRPVRRSPLESVHAALGASWVDDTARWPVSYGDEDAEALAVTERAGIADLGPIDKVLVQGARVDPALRAVGIVPVTGSVSDAAAVGITGARAWCLADDEVVLLMPGLPTAHPAPSPGELAGRVRAAGAAVTDLGSGLSVLRLVGPASVAILERACPVDVSTRAIPDRQIVQAPVAGVRLVVARQDHPAAPGYTLLVARDLAESVWSALLELGSDVGLMPVGATVAGPGSVDGGAGEP